MNGMCFVLRASNFLTVPEVAVSAPAGSKATPSDRAPTSCARTQLSVVCEGAGNIRCGNVSPKCHSAV